MKINLIGEYLAKLQAGVPCSPCNVLLKDKELAA